MRTIQLKPNGVGRYDNVSPFIVTDNRLELQITLPNFNGEFYLVYEINGKTNKRLLPRSGQLILEDLAAGEMYAEVQHCLKGETVKTYKVEPLLLKEVDGTLSALPEIEELRRSIGAVERAFNEYKESAEKRISALSAKFAERLEIAEKNVQALRRFALKDYQNNVYLSGGTEEDFIKEFGFTEKGEENDED